MSQIQTPLDGRGLVTAAQRSLEIGGAQDDIINCVQLLTSQSANMIERDIDSREN